MGEDEILLDDGSSQTLTARPDDVEAEPRDWDEWIVRSYSGKHQERAMIFSLFFV